MNPCAASGTLLSACMQSGIPCGPSAFVPRACRTLYIYVNLNVRRRYVVATSGQTIARHNVLIIKKLFPRIILVHGHGVLHSTRIFEPTACALVHDCGGS